MTQKQLIKEYLYQFGSILPAKLAGVVYKGEMFGSETSKRCRELRAEGMLVSEGDGKFERFYLKGRQVQESAPREGVPSYTYTKAVTPQAQAFLEKFGQPKEEKKIINTLF